MLYNTDIGILVYGSLYKKLNYHNHNLKNILILDKFNFPINYEGPDLPILLGRQNKYGHITRTLVNGITSKSTLIYLVKPEIKLDIVYKELGSREGGYLKNIGIYVYNFKKIIYDENKYDINIINLLLNELEKSCFKYNLKFILFAYFPYNMNFKLNLKIDNKLNEYIYYEYLKRYIKNNKIIYDKLYDYIYNCYPKSINNLEKRLFKIKNI
jgi:hypothetical protein